MLVGAAASAAETVVGALRMGFGFAFGIGWFFKRVG